MVDLDLWPEFWDDDQALELVMDDNVNLQYEEEDENINTKPTFWDQEHESGFLESVKSKPEGVLRKPWANTLRRISKSSLGLRDSSNEEVPTLRSTGSSLSNKRISLPQPSPSSLMDGENSFIPSSPSPKTLSPDSNRQVSGEPSIRGSSYSSVVSTQKHISVPDCSPASEITRFNFTNEQRPQLFQRGSSSESRKYYLI
ncbi:unnamed protein product [Kuraishia capsulata CBS 1993]|uniref:Uncharacterized protein n=1 Tax=Kuraishia capsulata CBS 1993 TaxID=1382522 RepID=W6MXZ2_9ASCO|nr:uncharacterized protein KUCA_T00005723001 [Kuraishia capsulata CBS 1993]CDK29730.1 unnamed protein product [Kuraishia capsulata CBS 1993]